VGFRATSGGVAARFTKSEASVIRVLVEQVVELVADAPSASANGTLDLIGLAGDEAPGAAASAANAAERIPDADELAAMVGLTGPTDLVDAVLPDDPVLARLLPDGYRDDPDAASEFRRFTESSLRSAKVQAARTLLETLPPGGGKVKLSTEHAEAWLRSLNDVRLALGVRLGVTEEPDEHDFDASLDDPRFAYILFIYHWLAELQDSLVAALSLCADYDHGHADDLASLA
jgi:Domain of unknown function (DUF2017)